MPLEPERRDRDESVPVARLAAFARQLAHDLNNDLNSLDLAATYISEIVEDVSAKEELATQRKTIRSISKTLKTVSRHLQPPIPSPIPIAACDLIGEVRERVSKYHPAELNAVTWFIDVGTSQLEVDFEMACDAFGEVIKNAYLYRDTGGKIEFHAAVNDGKLRVEIREEKASPPPSIERLGKTPLVSVDRRAYGLGLFYADRVVIAHGGGFTARHDSSRGVFVVEILLPLHEA